MNNFEKLNLKVVPVGENKRPYVKWSDPETWCDWEERDEIYPDNPTGDWYVIPGGKAQYYQDGIEWGYWILDLDRGHEEGDEKLYLKALKLLKKWGVPKTLTVRTKSGGLHIYYKAPAEYIPNTCRAKVNGVQLPIEVKSNVGWVAPNGKNRTVILDVPVAVFYPKDGTELAKAITISRHVQDVKLDPNFDISKVKIPTKSAGSRHNTLLGWAQFLKAKGCSFSDYLGWATQFYEKNNRRPQPREFENAWNWSGGGEPFVFRNEQDLNALTRLSDNAQRTELAKTVDDTTLKEKAHTEPVGGEELQGLELLEAQAVFSTEEEKVELRKKYKALKEKMYAV